MKRGEEMKRERGEMETQTRALCRDTALGVGRTRELGAIPKPSPPPRLVMVPAPSWCLGAFGRRVHPG